jgi:hypothetical protein
MKKMAGIVCAAFSLMIATTPVLAQTMTESSSTTYKPFQGTIKPFDQIQFQSAAMQSDGVHDYLKTMKMIMTKYTDVVYEVVMSNGGMPPTPDQMSTASAETQRLANHIGSVKAPQEIAADHKKLAMTLQAVDSFLKSSAGGGPAAMGQAFQMIAEVQSTMHSYRSAAMSLISKYNLPQSMDPFGNDKNNADKISKVQGMFDTMKGNLMGGGGGGGAGAGAADGGMGSWNPWGSSGGAGGGAGAANPLGALGSMLGGMGGAGGDTMGGLGGLGGLGGMGGGAAGGGGLGGLDMNQLMKQMQQLQGGMGGDGTDGLGE